MTLRIYMVSEAAGGKKIIHKWDKRKPAETARRPVIPTNATQAAKPAAHTVGPPAIARCEAPRNVAVIGAGMINQR
jgi:hypothetical protein